MGVEILGAPGGDGVQPNNPVTFTFENQVQAYALGIWAFTLTYGGEGQHWIQNLSLRILPQQSSPVATVGNVITAQVNAELQDSSGHTLDPAGSVIYPVCIAVTQNTDGNTYMTSVNDIANGSTAPVTLPAASGNSLVTSFLSGFDLAYANGDHQVLSAGAGCGIQYNTSEGTVSSAAHLYDAKDHRVDTATVDAGVVASTETAPGFAMKSVTGQTFDPVTVLFADELASVSGAFVMIESWTATYDQAHDVLEVRAGSFGPPKFPGNSTVVLPNLVAQIFDADGNIQDDASSSVTAWVVALP